MSEIFNFGKIGKLVIGSNIQKTIQKNLLSKGFNNAESNRLSSVFSDYDLVVSDDLPYHALCDSANKKLIVNSSWFTKKDNKLVLKSHLRKFFYFTLGHEANHSASAKDKKIRGIINSFGGKQPLNEGITQMIAEDSFGFTASPSSDGYRIYKKVAKILRVTFGDKAVYNSYFYQDPELSKQVDGLVKNVSGYYSLLNQDLEYIEKAKINVGRNFALRMADYIYLDIVYNIIIPKLKTLSPKEKDEYLKMIRQSLKDETDVEILISMTTTGLSYSKQDNIRNSIENFKFLMDSYSLFKQGKRKASDLIEFNSDNNICLKGLPFVTVNNDSMIEEILYKYFLEKNYPNNSSSQITQQEEQFDNKYLSSYLSNGISYTNRQEGMIKLAFIKKRAKENGKIVFNSFSEVNDGKGKISFFTIEDPKKSGVVKFDDLCKIAQKFKVKRDKNLGIVYIDAATLSRVSDEKALVFIEMAKLLERSGLLTPESQKYTAFILQESKNRLVSTGTLNMESICEKIDARADNKIKQALKDLTSDKRYEEIFYLFTRYIAENLDPQTELERFKYSPSKRK